MKEYILNLPQENLAYDKMLLEEYIGPLTGEFVDVNQKNTCLQKMLAIVHINEYNDRCKET